MSAWRRFWGSWVPALMVGAFSIAWSGTMLMRPRVGEPVAVLFPPGMERETALLGVLHSGADAIQSVNASLPVMLARSADPGFINKLYDNGAMAVLRAPPNGDCMGG